MTKTPKQIRKEIEREFRRARTNAISEMFDNPDKYGIYPTTKFFKVLDDSLGSSILKALKAFSEGTRVEKRDDPWAYGFNVDMTSGFNRNCETKQKKEKAWIKEWEK